MLTSINAEHNTERTKYEQSKRRTTSPDPTETSYLSYVQTLETHMHFSMSTASQAKGARKRFACCVTCPRSRSFAYASLCPCPCPDPSRRPPPRQFLILRFSDRGQSIHIRTLESSWVTIFALLHWPMCVMEHFIQEYLQRVAWNESVKQTERRFPHIVYRTQYHSAQTRTLAGENSYSYSRRDTKIGWRTPQT